MRFQDTLSRARDAVRIGMGMLFKDDLEVSRGGVKGEVFIEVRDGTTGDLLDSRHIKNLVTLDASLLVASLLKDPLSRGVGINMLAVGTGAPGPILSPNAPDNRERKLFAELARKPFSSTTYRDGSGSAVAFVTNVVDYVVSFSEAEAVGPINEMALLSSISSNPSILNLNPDVFSTRTLTVDVSSYDIFATVLNFSVISKPSTATLSITYRLTS